ncbi:hypothetical protein CYMTET_7047 [Cymbomonas tetramitiformis]|uniref:Mitochondrial inner membrane protease ATP23 n=1 Tax=Cymbomonas tetramitiformis TaxID=36881 RepID=A0AAE0GW71_9CHLO|nr:hypothetical protein CYMTET_7047 [Cymbomonas tetramitiformis]
MTPEKCDKALDYAMARNPMVKFMIDAMEKSGCKIDKSFFTVQNCGSSKFVGGFELPAGILLCSDAFVSQEQLDHTVTHELIHAFDHCRAKNLDWYDCRHHACSEVRAAALSGDCNWKQEVYRQNFGLKAQHQACVKRRAELSLKINPYCKDIAKKAVEEVFDTCYRDTAPFDRLP